MPGSTKRKRKVVASRNMGASGYHFQDGTGLHGGQARANCAFSGPRPHSRGTQPAPLSIFPSSFSASFPFPVYVLPRSLFFFSPPCLSVPGVYRDRGKCVQVCRFLAWCWPGYRLGSVSVFFLLSSSYQLVLPFSLAGFIHPPPPAVSLFTLLSLVYSGQAIWGENTEIGQAAGHRAGLEEGRGSRERRWAATASPTWRLFSVCFCLFFSSFCFKLGGAGPRDGWMDGWMESRCRRQVCDESGQVSLSLSGLRSGYPTHPVPASLPTMHAHPHRPHQPLFVFALGYFWLLGRLDRAVAGWDLASPPSQPHIRSAVGINRVMVRLVDGTGGWGTGRGEARSRGTNGEAASGKEGKELGKGGRSGGRWPPPSPKRVYDR